TYGSYQETGSDWLGNRQLATGAFWGDYRYALGTTGTPASTSKWTFDGLLPGTYSVFITWPESASRASNATYRVFDGAIGPIARNGSTATTFVANQKFAPNGAVVDGRPWV